MVIMRKNLYYTILVLLFFSCKKEEMEIRKEINFAAFSHIALNSDFEVYLKEDTVYKIELVGYQNSIKEVEVLQVMDTLYFANNRKIKWLTPTKNKIKIYVTSLPLKKVMADEGCYIQTINPITSAEFGLVLSGKTNEANLELNTNIFYYWNDFTGGKLTLKGNTNILKLWNFALMTIDAKALVANVAVIENSSKGSCNATVLKKLEYSISGKGNIEIFGNPIEVVNHGISSTGKLILH